MAEIYVLHIEDGPPMYVGQTARSSARRLSEHKYKAMKQVRSPLYAWICEVGIKNVRVTVLEEVDDESRLERELFYSELLPNLLNVDVTSPEFRKKQSAAVRSYVRENGSPNVGRIQTEETRQKISQSTKGRVPWNKGVRHR